MYCTDCGKEHNTTVCPYHSQVMYPPQGLEVKPYLCPVCGGNGIRPSGFYSQTSGEWLSADTSTIPCRSCNGTGVVWG